MRRHAAAFTLSLTATLLALIVAATWTDLPDLLFPETSTTEGGATPAPATTQPVSPPAATQPPGAAGTTAPNPRRTVRPPTPKRSPAPPSPAPSPQYTFPVAGCEVQYAQTHHNYPAVDIFTARGCAFVAPVSGTVDEVTTADTWSSTTNVGANRGGLSVSVVGADGVRYYGSHLERVAGGIVAGTPVQAGQELGRIGDTGSARGTGTHLHFGISWPTPRDHWWIRRGALAPQPYLDAWRAGTPSSPAAAVKRVRASYGDDSRCRTYC